MKWGMKSVISVITTLIGMNAILFSAGFIFAVNAKTNLKNPYKYF